MEVKKLSPRVEMMAYEFNSNGLICEKLGAYEDKG